MAKPLSDEALLVAKALKNFDPDKYDWYNIECCLAGQYQNPRTKGVDFNFSIFCDLNDIAKNLHDTLNIPVTDGKALKQALYKKYGLAEVK